MRQRFKQGFSSTKTSSVTGTGNDWQMPLCFDFSANIIPLFDSAFGNIYTLSFLVHISLLCSILLLAIFIVVMISEKYTELEISNQDRNEANCLSCSQCYINAQNSMERYMEKFLKVPPIHASLYDNVRQLTCVFVSPNLAFLFSFIFLSTESSVQR